MERLYEMLPQQKRIWETQMTYAGTDVCNIGGYLHLEGKYDAELLQKTMELFLQGNSSFWMKVSPRGKIYFDRIEQYSMKEYDVTGLSEAETDQLIQNWICEPFFCYDSYLFDFRLLHLTGRTIIFEKFHHLIADGYTVALCAKYQEQIYERLLLGDEKPVLDERYLAEAVKGTVHRVSDQAKQEQEKQEEYSRLVSVAKRTRNPSAAILSGWLTERNDDSGEQWMQHKFSYPQIRAFCRRERVSVEALFYGCLAMYLCRTADADALAIGRDLLARKKEELTVTGMKVKTCAVLIKPEWELPAAEFLAGLKKKLAFHALEQRDMDLRPEIEISYRPTPYLPAPKKGECVEFYSSSSETPVKVFLNEERSGVELTVKFQKEAVFEPKVRQMISGTIFFMEQILECPRILCSRLSFFREEEREKKASVRQGRDWRFFVSLPERFLDMVRTYPGRTALLFKGRAYTYQDFWRIVRQIMGVISECADWEKAHVIGLCLHRTPYLPAAVYAAWLKGCAYLPVSPMDSAERRRQLFSHCALCLTDDMLEKACKEKEVEKDEDEISCFIRPDLPAYEMYTSGTTGKPKAVQISHASLSCRLEWMMDQFGNGAGRILQKTRSTFDVSVWELVMPFAFGNSLYLLEEGKEADPKSIAEALRLGSITMAHFVPSVFERFVSFLEKENPEFPDLKYLILSGEEPGAGLIKRAVKKLSGTQIYNLYGPTECTIDVSFYRCTGREERIPLGTPVYGTRLSVRNARGEILPAGECGELTVEGSLAGIGYRDEKEGEDSGYCMLEGVRAYRTGDLAVMSEDGLFYYEGRKDDQIKIRGMRISLSEVERALHDAAPDIYSRVIEIGGRLVAFCSLEYGKDGRKTAICREGGMAERMRREASARLPYYGVPSEFVFVKQIPLKDNGKADRQALERIYENKCKNRAAVSYAADWEVSERERTLLWLAEKHLNRKDLTLDGNLFDYGMDSLTVLSFLTDCEAWGIFISYESIYRNPYLKALAREGKRKRQELSFLQKEGSRQLLLAVPFAGGTPFHMFSLAKEFSQEELDVASINMEAFRGKSIDVLTEKLAKSEELRAYERIYVLGSCVGSVCAIQLAAALNGRLGGLMLCEALPNRSCFWDYVPDRILAEILQKFRGRRFFAGRELLERFREDVRRSARYLGRMKKSFVKGKTVLVFGEKDPVTFGWRRRAKQWHKWIQNPFVIYAVPGARHFLTEDHAVFLADIFRREFLRKDSAKVQRSFKKRTRRRKHEKQFISGKKHSANDVS